MITWDEEYDPQHPVPEGVERFIGERHWHEVSHDANDEFVMITASVVYREVFGTHIELGPWSMSPDEARLLAASLQILADTASEAAR